VQRNRIITALAATLALAACTPDAAERVTGPGRSSYDHQQVPNPAPIGDSVVVQAVEGGNAFGSGT
jgi:hypothetical protein